MVILFRSGVALLASAATLAVAADPASPLAPATKWQMDYAPNECRLLRSFGTGRDAVTVQFSRLDPVPHLEMTLVGQRLPATATSMPTRFSTTTILNVDARAQGYAGQGAVLPSIHFQPNAGIAAALRSDAVASQPTRLGVKFGRGFAATIDLGSMKGPLAALDTCVDDLVRTMGLDPAEQRARASGPEPVGNVGEWFRPGDYPPALNRMVAGGVVVVRLVVGANGAVTDCAVAKAGGDRAFEELTCSLATERGRFTPARGSAGQPIASVWARRIRWQPAAPFVVRGG